MNTKRIWHAIQNRLSTHYLIRTIYIFQAQFESLSDKRRQSTRHQSDRTTRYHRIAIWIAFALSEALPHTHLYRMGVHISVDSDCMGAGPMRLRRPQVFRYHKQHKKLDTVQFLLVRQWTVTHHARTHARTHTRTHAPESCPHSRTQRWRV